MTQQSCFNHGNSLPFSVLCFATSSFVYLLIFPIGKLKKPMKRLIDSQKILKSDLKGKFIQKCRYTSDRKMKKIVFKILLNF